MSREQLSDGQKTNGEIWYLTFEGLNEFGSGLASYCRETVEAAKVFRRPIRLFELSREQQTIRRLVDSHITRVFVSDKIKNNYSALGYWPHVSYAFADAVLEEIRLFGAPKLIEVPDGFGIGYFLL